MSLRPPRAGEEQVLVAGRDTEWERWLGPGEGEPQPTALILVGDKIVGWVDYDTGRDWLGAHEVNIGYNVFAPYRQRGYATRGVALLLGLLQDRTDHQRANLVIDVGNTASLGVARAIGAQVIQSNFDEAGRLSSLRHVVDLATFDRQVSRVHKRRGRATPVLWLFGPPGVGKSTIGWQIYQRLSGHGFGCAYVDIDQLGMCLPEPVSDPGRYRLKDRGLGALVANFAEAGARGVVVSGVIDPVGGTSLAELAELNVALCRLRARPDQLRQRLASRRGSFARVEDAIAEAVRLDASRIAQALVDTSDLTVEQAAEAVLQTSAWAPDAWPTEPPADLRYRPPSSAGGQVIWICGPTGVGKSTIGFALYLKLLRAGRTAGYIDAGQIGFCSVAPHAHWLKAHNLAAVWENYRSAGAKTLVAVGPVRDRGEASVYEAVLPQVSFKWFRLHSGPVELARRLQTRQQGGSWPQPGDPLRGAAMHIIHRAAADATAQAAELDRVGIGIRVDTERLTVEESARAVLREAKIASEP